MILRPSEAPLKKRLAVALALGACALALTGADLLVGRGTPAGVPSGRLASDAGIAAALDTLYARFGIELSNVRTWRSTAGGVPTGRIEQRVGVGPGFPGLEFNYALSLRCAPFGARVVATERTRENSVTMHIVRGGTTVRSLSFVQAPEP